MVHIVYKYILSCMFCLTLSACVKYIDVPIWVCPAPNIPPKEFLKTEANLSQASEADILKAITWDLVYLKGRTQSLELLLEGYKRPPEDLKKLLPVK